MDSRKDILFSLAVIALGVAVIYIAYSWPEPLVPDTIGPRAFPYGLGLLFICGGVFNAWQRTRNLHAANGYRVPDEGGEEEEGIPGSGVRAMAMIGLCVLWTILLNPIGFVVVTPLFVAGALIVMEERKPFTVIVTAIAFTVVTYVLLHTVLGGRLPEGILAGMLPY